MDNYYKLLEVDENCSLDDIKKAYRRLAKKYHPDICKEVNAHQKFIEINEAYEVLQKRAQQAASAPSDRNTPTAQEYDEFIRHVREQAKKQANMRYQKFAQQHEAFRESGLQDVVLLLSYLGRAVLPLLGLGLIALPIAICISEHSFQPFMFLFLFWVIGGFLLFLVYIKRKDYFKLGGFYYTFDKLLDFYKHTNETSKESCFYCHGRKANSWPYVIHMIEIKDIKLKNSGPLQHQAGYDRKNLAIKIPRSQKAFILHSISTAIKIICILGGMIFIPFGSLVWSFIGGAFLGYVLSSSLLLVTQTRSKSAYLLSYGMLVKIGIWIIAISLCSKFYASLFNIETNGYIRFVFFVTIFVDSVIEQLLKISKKHLFKPLLQQYKNTYDYFDRNCQLYLEIPGWTTIYPMVRWIF